MIIETLADIQALKESVDIECKAAQGRDGNGALPQSIWETYSAMANTKGGNIFLGIEELDDHSFRVVGVKDTGKVIKSFWDTINSTKKVNKCILQDSDLQIIDIDGHNIIHIRVPRAGRKDCPIYLGENPFGNTYRRRHEGDYKLPDETVKRMLAEAVEDARDNRILEYYTIEDLNIDSINEYRNRYSAAKPENPWLDLSLEEFLLRIKVLGKDRETGKQGVRVAGLLMFGRYDTIIEEFPNYMVDYQERPEPKANSRWIDRIVPDGTWSGNLYDFYKKVIRKLTADLKIPFQLQGENRVDDTPVHQALREALTNCLIHADYTGRVSVLVVKRPDLFGFRNPGMMRVSVAQAMTGGISDCRNRLIQDLFRFVGLGERAGSGVPGILKSWDSQHWKRPLLYEDPEYEQTLLELRTSSLLPDESIKSLSERFGDRFARLTELQRIILVTADAENLVSHARITSLSTAHPKDISADLAYLVKEKMLVKEGATRDSVYYLPGARKSSPFNEAFLFGMQTDNVGNSPVNSLSSPDKELNSPVNNLSSSDKEEQLRTILQKHGYHSMPERLSPQLMQEIIVEICTDNWLILREISHLIERKPEFVRDQYLKRMVAENTLELKYPESKNHPHQAYRTRSD